MAINITVKFTIHLEHTRKARFFIPAFMVWSRLNISFQKICINLHRPYTVHKLWKGLFFSAPPSLQLSKIQQDYLQQSVIYSFLRSFIHQCFIKEKQVWLRFKSIHSSLQYLRWWTHGSQDRSFFLKQCFAKNKDLWNCTAMSRVHHSLTLPHVIKWISPLKMNSYC